MWMSRGMCAGELDEFVLEFPSIFVRQNSSTASADNPHALSESWKYHTWLFDRVESD